MDKSNYCNISNSTLLAVDIISSTFPIVSVIACALALVLIAYYKLHHSFNYRLVLYLLVSHFMNSVTNTLQVPFLWLKNDTNKEEDVFGLCVVVAYMKVYCTWSVALSTTIVIVEISLMIMRYYQLRIREGILIIICFFFPTLFAFIPLAGWSYGSTEYYICGFKHSDCQTTNLEMYDEYMYVPITIISCIGMAAMGNSTLPPHLQLYTTETNLH